MTEFWEQSFRKYQAMWGSQAAKSAVIASDVFQQASAKNVLIPGCGYGRNAQVFVKAGFDVTGIEIAQTAINLAREAGLTFLIHHGNITEMPFDQKMYEGIFSYALLHLLDKATRRKFINNCYEQLAPGASMVFTTITKEAPMFGKGIKISENEYESPNGVRLYFYDQATIQTDFRSYGLVEACKIEEVDSDNSNKNPIPFWWIHCQKPFE